MRNFYSGLIKPYRPQISLIAVIILYIANTFTLFPHYYSYLAMYLTVVATGFFLLNKIPLRRFRIGLAVLLMFITAAGTTYHLVPQLGNAFRLGIFGDFLNFGIAVFLTISALLSILLYYPDPARLEKAVGVTLLVTFCTGMLSMHS